MEEIKKILDESSNRLLCISDLINENFTGDSVDMEISKLFDIAKEMDSVKLQAIRQEAAFNNCKKSLKQSEEPWNCDVKEMLKENLKKENEKGSKKKSEFFKKLEKHLKKDENDESIIEMEAVEITPHSAIDPWTKQPIEKAVQSKACKHIYDKRSIACITRKRNQFKCPYVGCQNVVAIQDLIDLD